MSAEMFESADEAPAFPATRVAKGCLTITLPSDWVDWVGEVRKGDRWRVSLLGDDQAELVELVELLVLDLVAPVLWAWAPTRLDSELARARAIRPRPGGIMGAPTRLDSELARARRWRSVDLDDAGQVDLKAWLREHRIGVRR